MGKVPVELSIVLLVDDEQKEALDSVLFDEGELKIKTLNGNIHNIEMANFDIMDGEDYIFEVKEEASLPHTLRGEVNNEKDLAI